jgi:NADPH:quinone reductase
LDPTYQLSISALEPKISKLCLILPERKFPDISEDVNYDIVNVGKAHSDSISGRDFAYGFCRYLSRWLAEGRLTGHPYKVAEHGLASIGEALSELKEGKTRRLKHVFRVADTPGL